MKLFKFQTAYLGQGKWQSPFFVQTDRFGKIIHVGNKKPPSATITKTFPGILIPGVPNAHSHVFQRSFAGLVEFTSPQQKVDDFWSWRTKMYEYANEITPDQLREVATTTYKAMIANGYTSVAEFHYIHHAPGGKPYSNRAEMMIQLMEAAKKTGMRLTLLPVLYERGGFDKQAEEHQKRFVSQSIDDYMKLVDTTLKASDHYDRVRVGLCAHSLRAVEPTHVKEIFKNFPGKPKHIHAAEQTAEVDACLEHLKSRPVRWLLDHIDLKEDLNIVHATHMNEDEMRDLAKSKAIAVVCPTTEANLGDGIFALGDFTRHHGHVAIGSDSNVCLSPWEEIRWLDYVQRLLFRKRVATDVRDPGGICELGDLFFDWIWQSGRKSCGLTSNSFYEIGETFEGVVMQAQECIDKALSRLIYAWDRNIIEAVVVGGKVLGMV